MRVISLKPLREFWERYPDAEQPLRQWYKTTAFAEWTSLQDVRQDYPHADGIRTQRGDTLTVFNIGGNKYRLVARIRYDYQLVNIRAVLTHREYDEGQWKE
jgi:mRNA interferase HigB